MILKLKPDKMKKITLTIMAFSMLLTMNPSTLKAGTEAKQEVTTSVNTMDQQKADALIIRLNEINEMDKSNLNSSEKSELRSEVLSIKNQLSSGPVIYISAGALILIIILLIILL